MAKYLHKHMIIDSSLDIIGKTAFHDDVFIEASTNYSGQNAPYALVVEDVDDLYQIQTIQLSPLATADPNDYYTKLEVDDLKTEIDASIARIDASLNDVVDIFDILDASFAEYVKKEGDTMTGNLVFDNDTGIHFEETNSGFYGVDTSFNGLSDEDEYIPSSGLLSSLLDAIENYQGIQDASILAAASSVPGVKNGLSILSDGSIGLGGNISEQTTIVVDATSGAFSLKFDITAADASLEIDGLKTTLLNTPYAVVTDFSDGGALKTFALGTMASEDASNYVAHTDIVTMSNKYTGTFNGNTSDTYTVYQNTHGLPAAGPYTTAVYEFGKQVYIDVEINEYGDVTFSWATGSLTDNLCKYIITG